LKLVASFWIALQTLLLFSPVAAQALVVPVSSRGAELSALWLMPIGDLLDLAVTHQLGHALSNEKDEPKASRVAKMLKDGISPSCATNLVGKTESQRSHWTLLLASQVSSSVAPDIPVLRQHFACSSSCTLKHCKNDMRVLKVALPFSSAAQQDPTLGPPPASPEMPFQLHSGYLIVVEGRVGRLSGLKFMLDTGVTYSILDTKIADSLNLGVPRHPHHVVNYDKRVSIESATIPEVQFGPVHRTNQEMFIADLSKFSDFARDVDALIGLDLLQLNNVTFDYDVRKVLFSPIDHNVEGVQMRSELICFTVRVQVQGHPVHLILDTGLEGVLLYEDRIRTNVPGLRMEAGAKRVTIGGRMKAKLATLPEMRLGSTVMDGRVLLMEGPPGNLIEGIDGYIGIAPFNARRITLNFASKTVNWE
jgi:predicted aspartyl protease